MEPTSILQASTLTPRTSLHHSKSPLPLIWLTSSPMLSHWRTIRHIGKGVRNAPPPPYLVCTLATGRPQQKVTSSLNFMPSSQKLSSPQGTLPSIGSKDYPSCLKSRKGYASHQNYMPSYSWKLISTFPTSYSLANKSFNGPDPQRKLVAAGMVTKQLTVPLIESSHLTPSGKSRFLALSPQWMPIPAMTAWPTQ